MSEEQKKAGLGKKLGMGCLVVIGVLVALTVLGAIVGDKNSGKSTSTAASSDSPVLAQKDDAAQPEADPAPAPAEEPESSLTGPQANAARSAQQYLDMSGFSRLGLIDQLSSDAGNGYEKADATAAVDSLNVDWNEQAARSAKQYLDMSGFSCKGLIEQLSSDAGNQYTKAQAAYGAQQAGAC